jgi:flagellar biosynthesis activator protein FlaF
MPSLQLASRAYAAASANMTVRQQEAELFWIVNARLRVARHDGPVARVRALADNRRLWMAVADQLRDPSNSLPAETRAGLLSIGLSVQREIDSDDPGFDFLIAINKTVAEGLSGNP